MYYEVEFYFSDTQTISAVLTSDALAQLKCQINSNDAFRVPTRTGDQIYIVPRHVQFFYVSANEEDSE